MPSLDKIKLNINDPEDRIRILDLISKNHAFLNAVRMPALGILTGFQLRDRLERLSSSPDKFIKFLNSINVTNTNVPEIPRLTINGDFYLQKSEHSYERLISDQLKLMEKEKAKAIKSQEIQERERERERSVQPLPVPELTQADLERLNLSEKSVQSVTIPKMPKTPEQKPEQLLNPSESNSLKEKGSFFRNVFKAIFKPLLSDKKQQIDQNPFEDHALQGGREAISSSRVSFADQFGQSLATSSDIDPRKLSVLDKRAYLEVLIKNINRRYSVDLRRFSDVEIYSEGELNEKIKHLQTHYDIDLSTHNAAAKPHKSDKYGIDSVTKEPVTPLFCARHGAGVTAQALDKARIDKILALTSDEPEFSSIGINLQRELSHIHSLEKDRGVSQEYNNYSKHMAAIINAAYKKDIAQGWNPKPLENFLCDILDVEDVEEKPMSKGDKPKQPKS